MRILSTLAIGILSAWIGLHVNAAAAQNFNDRWSIIPKAKADTVPEAGSPAASEPQTNRTPPAPESAPAQMHSPKRSFSGKASFYSYRKARTAEGKPFDRDMLTAAHRSLPFGTHLRVTDAKTGKSVTVVITDRGPHAHGRVLDLSLGAARSLGITDRGVIKVEAEVL